MAEPTVLREPPGAPGAVVKPSTMSAVIFGALMAVVGFGFGLWLLIDRAMHGGAP